MWYLASWLIYKFKLLQCKYIQVLLYYIVIVGSSLRLRTIFSLLIHVSVHLDITLKCSTLNNATHQQSTRINGIPLYILLSYPTRVVQYAFEPSSQEPHTEYSQQHSVHVIQMDNTSHQQISQSHTWHVCDATYPAMLVTHSHYENHHKS